MTSFPEECVRFACPSGGQKSRQSASPGPECLRGAPATVAAGQEKRLDDSRGRCEIRSALPCRPSLGWSQLQAERPPGASVCCPGARTPAPPAHAAVSPPVPSEYHPLRPPTESLSRPFPTPPLFP